MTALADRGPVPALDTRLGWQGREAPVLDGKVVLFGFWTFGCVNCRRTLPCLRAWYDRYAPDGLEIVGIHHPEFAYEADRAAISAASSDLGVTWPLLYDDDASNWKAFANRYRPQLYLADRSGHLRYDRIGEGAYDTTEDAIRQLLGLGADAPRAAVPA